MSFGELRALKQNDKAYGHSAAPVVGGVCCSTTKPSSHPNKSKCCDATEQGSGQIEVLAGKSMESRAAISEKVDSRHGASCCCS